MQLNRYSVVLSITLAALLYPLNPGSEPVEEWELNVVGLDAHAQTVPQRIDELSKLAILNRAIIHIKENYVEPQRIDPQKMLIGALEHVEDLVDEFILQHSSSSDKPAKHFMVRIGEHAKSFDLQEVKNLWTLAFKLKDVFRFLLSHRPAELNSRDVEYAAINGMLSTLDPHSRLLAPEDYREMKLSTQGKFGGLGIVINIQDGLLTVVRPIEDTPAARAGIRSGDQIVQIGLDSTINMNLDEAVDLLRGEPNTRVAIWVKREGWSTPKRFLLRRANVKVRSVVSRLVRKRIALIRIHNFQSTTTDELIRAINILKKKAKGALKGLILDLRQNPGGLLNQAVNVADLFVPSGPLVTTVGHGEKMRKLNMATRANTNTTLPIVALIDGSSASASEIVAGALKNHNRALIIGERSFGKGSVQVIYDNRDESALKLTIAQYLTPGDVSIQSVGIRPDIRVRGLMVDSENVSVDLFDGPRRDELSLKKHLNQTPTHQDKEHSAQSVIEYLRQVELEQKIQKDPNRLYVDFETRLAAAILERAKNPYREGLIKESHAVLAEWSVKTNEQLIEELNEFDVDWRMGSDQSQSAKSYKAEVSFETNAQAKPILAGDKAKITIRIKNTGKATYHRLHGISRSDNDQFDNQEFIFGRLEPGEAKEWTVSVDVAPDSLTQSFTMTIDFKAEHGKGPDSIRVPLRINALDAPDFGLSYIIDDSRTGNGDGLIQVQEDVELVLTVVNHGPGEGRSVLSTFRAGPDAPNRKLFVRRGRVKSEPIKVGQTQDFRFRFRVNGNEPVELPVRIGVGDPKLGSYTLRKINLRAVGPLTRLSAQDVTVRPAAGASIQLYAQPSLDSGVIGWVPGTAAGRSGFRGWYRVPLESGTFGWAEANALNQVQDTLSDHQARRAGIPAPIKFTINQEDSLRNTRQESIKLSGHLVSDIPLKDLRIYLNSRKIHFQAAGAEKTRNRIEFAVEPALKIGLNRIDLVARSEYDPGHRYTVIIHREK